jgi:hypothetical protein
MDFTKTALLYTVPNHNPYIIFADDTSDIIYVESFHIFSKCLPKIWIK